MAQKIKTTEAHRALMRRKHFWPLLWGVLKESPDYLIVYNRLTGRITVLYK